jgi:hypothetical protein
MSYLNLIFFTKYKNQDYHAGGDIVTASWTLDDSLNRHKLSIVEFSSSKFFAEMPDSH